MDDMHAISFLHSSLFLFFFLGGGGGTSFFFSSSFFFFFSFGSASLCRRSDCLGKRVVMNGRRAAACSFFLFFPNYSRAGGRGTQKKALRGKGKRTSSYQFDLPMRLFFFPPPFLPPPPTFSHSVRTRSISRFGTRYGG